MPMADIRLHQSEDNAGPSGSAVVLAVLIVFVTTVFSFKNAEHYFLMISYCFFFSIHSNLAVLYFFQNLVLPIITFIRLFELSSH